jgi:hypothetical protein
MSQAVKDMLLTDIQLKQVVARLFQEILRKQTVLLVLISIGLGSIVIFSIYYFTEPTHIDTEVVEALRVEREELRKERLLISAERQRMNREREIFYDQIRQQLNLKYEQRSDSLHH